MQTVIGLFDTASEAQQAVEHLKNNGFTSGNIDLSVSNNDNNLSDSSLSGSSLSDSNNTGSNYTTGYSTDKSGDSSANSRSLNETLRGNTSGSNDNITTGPAASTTGSNDGLGNKVGNFFKNLFGDNDDEANRYTHVASKASNIVTVHAQTEEEAEEAADILDECGAVDVNARASEYGYSGSDYGSGRNATDGLTGDNDETLKVIKEDVQVGKKEVETGGVRLKSRIVERPVEEQLRLREERVTVQRTPVDRIATEADIQNFKEGEIEMTERAEIASVSKQARVVEEVKLSKEVNERVQTVHETARDTEVDVENLDKSKTGKKSKGKNL